MGHVAPHLKRRSRPVRREPPSEPTVDARPRILAMGYEERTMIAKGSFDLTMHPEPPYDAVDGVTLARVRFDKRFAGPLEATSEVNMMAARTPVDGSAGYVAIERVVGALEGKRGTFVLQHS